MAVGLLGTLMLAAGPLGWLSGRAPEDLGVRDGRLKAPADTPNSVSSQASLWSGAMAAQARIDPLPVIGDGPSTLARLRTEIESMPGARVIEAHPDYLYVQFTTRWMRFVDDAEFWFDPAAGAIQVRSASRIGSSDLGVNRQRIEALRSRLAPR